jgi:hypothetical protein
LEQLEYLSALAMSVAKRNFGNMAIAQQGTSNERSHLGTNLEYLSALAMSVAKR